jgi:predicted secreted protein
MARTFSKNDRIIRVRPGERFAILLDATPTAGYEWQANVRGESVELADASLAPGTEGLGAAASQRFEFRSKEAGRSEIELVLARPWEKKPIETVRFEVEAE